MPPDYSKYPHCNLSEQQEKEVARFIKSIEHVRCPRWLREWAEAKVKAPNDPNPPHLKAA